MNLRNICIILIIISLFAIGTVSAGVGTTVDGVDFILEGNVQIISHDGNYTSFKIKEGMTGYITPTSVGDDLDSYILNDTESGYAVTEVALSDKNVREYSFVNETSGYGYFIAFQKDNKDFIYLIQNEGFGSDKDDTLMAQSLSGFRLNNKDIKPIQ